MNRFVLPVIALLIVGVAFFIGVFTQTPELMLVWLCLHPFAWFFLGRRSLAQ